MTYYVVKYTGPFGFIKPWTAVRDSETFSQQFLTPSIVEGIRQKLEVGKIIRHKLTYESISRQQEVTHTRGWKYYRARKLNQRDRSILVRGIMLNPDLFLALENKTDARKAAQQHICLCRNEDVLFPEENIRQMSESEFDALPGFELRFGENDHSFLVGFDRFNQGQPMYGWLEVSGNPLKTGRAL
jgi:hypothetical protein